MEEYYRTYAIVHKKALLKNVENAYKRVGRETKIMAVIKADAYGHGAVWAAKALEKAVYGFAVATVEEAVELRKAGISNPILILGYVAESEYKTVLDNDITMAVLSEEMGKKVSEFACKNSMTARCHIKINTGMNRIGFPVCDESVDEIERVCKLKGIDAEGVFMHFCTSDEKDKTFSKIQYEKFVNMIDRLKERGVEFRIKHCSNSAAIVDLPEYRMDMVREGIILYGLEPSDEVDPSMEYNKVMEIKSHVIFVKELGAGEGISYGRTYITSQKRKIATVAIGYADGYPRSLSSKGYVLIHGKKAPITGRVCMDQMMVDVTDIEDVKVEDVVTIVGRDGDQEITVEELGALSGRFNYEFVCDISRRVKRFEED